MRAHCAVLFHIAALSNTSPPAGQVGVHAAGVRPERHRGLLRLSHNLLQETFCPVLNPVISNIKSLYYFCSRFLHISKYFCSKIRTKIKPFPVTSWDSPQWLLKVLLCRCQYHKVIDAIKETVRSLYCKDKL